MEGNLATEIPNSITILFALMNPFALLGIYINLTEKYKPREKKKILIVMVIAINAILFVFLFTGTQLLNFFGASSTRHGPPRPQCEYPCGFRCVRNRP